MNPSIRSIAWQLPMLVLALGCSSCATMSGAWYYQTSDNDSDLFLAVVNDSNDVRPIASLDVNSAEQGGALSWRCTPPSKDAVALAPGQLLVVALPASSEHRCAVPTQGRATLVNGKPLKFKLPRSMPTALPDGWRTTCTANAAFTPTAPLKTCSEIGPDRNGKKGDSAFSCEPCRGGAAKSASTLEKRDSTRSVAATK